MNTEKRDTIFRIMKQRALALVLFFVIWLVFLAIVGRLNIWTALISGLVIFASSYLGALTRVSRDARKGK
jgi:hypothetical protein